MASGDDGRNGYACSEVVPGMDSSVSYVAAPPAAFHVERIRERPRICEAIVYHPAGRPRIETRSVRARTIPSADGMCAQYER